MANLKKLQSLSRHLTYFLSQNPHHLISTQSRSHTLFSNSLNTSNFASPKLNTVIYRRSFCSHRSSGDGESDVETDSDDDDDDDDVAAINREYSPEEKEKEAAEIGYKVIGPLQKSDRVFKPYEPVFAVVQIGSHQFKVSNGDSIFTERLKFCEVNDKLILNKVLLLGSKTQTIIGRPILPDAAVHAVVEEHALDAKVLIFKKKRRKNYRRTRGHRQELTKLRITDIQGVEKPEVIPILKTQKKGEKQVKVAA